MLRLKEKKVTIVDKTKTIELHIDNILRGIVKIDHYLAEEFKNTLVNKLDRWAMLYDDKSKDQEFEHLTEDLHSLILQYRIDDIIQGKLEEIENEKKIKELELQVYNLDEANKRLAEELLQYKTPTQSKEYRGTG